MSDTWIGFRKFSAGVVAVSLGLAQVFVLLPTPVSAAASIEVGDIVINEVYAAPTAGTDEQVELYNRSAKNFDASDLVNLALVDSDGNVFGDNWVSAIAGGLTANGYLVIEEASSVLNNAGDSVILNNGSTQVNSMSYSDTSLGGSLQRIPNGTGNFISFDTPTLGSVNIDDPNTVSGSPVEVSIAYRAAGALAPATEFTVGSIRPEVTVVSHILNESDEPSITFARPNSTAVTMPLIFDTTSDVWTTSGAFDVSPSVQSSTDGAVVVALSTTSGKSFDIVTGESFVIDTMAQKPTVTMVSRCGGQQDSFSAHVENDVNQVLIYRSNDLGSANLVAVASATQGHVDEVFIGDNVFESLYLVAKDRLGNLSGVSVASNDVAAPSVPYLQIETGDGKAILSWNNVAGAKDYTVRWRPSGQDAWNEVITSQTTYELGLTNGVMFDFGVASRDAACNQSEFAVKIGTPQVVQGGEGGQPDTRIAAEWEAEMLTRSLAIAEEKDGIATQSSPYSIEEDKDQNGVKDSDEGKSSTLTPSPVPTDKGVEATTQQSKWIITIAILLIIAGVAIAVYSWYQRDDQVSTVENSTPNDDAPSAKENDVETEEVKDAKKSGGAKGSAKRGKRKSRW